MTQTNRSTRYTTPKQVATILTHQLSALKESPALAHQLPPIMLWGPPGVGKSSIIREVCNHSGVDFIDIRLSQREPVDLRGLPVPKGDSVDWLISGEWPRDPNSRGIILFDEITAADRSLQVAAYELILDRRLGNLYNLPDGWLVVAAGNRAEDRAVATTFSSALANRFCHLDVGADLESWCQWAAANGIHPDIIGFVRFRPECFFNMQGNVEQGWPSPRSWTRVANILTNLSSRLDESTVGLMIQGLVGAPASTEFLAFRRWSNELPDIPAMLHGKCPIHIPERADQRFAFCSGLAHHLWKGPVNQEQQRLDRFFEISMQLSSDFATLALLDATAGSSNAEQEYHTTEIFCHASFESWSEKHGKVFNQHLAQVA
ncbi:ATP-binding protein [Marinobacter sp.]|uniref:ATP-binding protein n=1 Tax=Marinobacter sp. TaxID=50741 RepID=UPI003A8EBA9F